MKAKILLAIISPLILAISSSAQTISPYVPLNGLVAWWPFSDNTIDESGNGHHAIVFGAKPTKDRNSVDNSAFYFINDSMRVLKTENFNLTEFSVSGWLKTSMLGTQYHTMFSHFLESNGLKGYWAGVYQNKACLWIGEGKVVGNSILGLAKINDGTWHFIAGTYNGHSGKIYVDGVLEDTMKCSMVLTPSQTYIGNDQQHEYFTGSLDEIGVWNRELSAKEVYVLYKQVPNVIGNLDKDNFIELLPNPVKDNLTIKVHPHLIGSNYRIYNLVGSLIKSGKLESKTSTIQLGYLPVGLYLIYLGQGIKQKILIRVCLLISS